MATNAMFRHVEAEGKPNKKSKKGGAKGSVAILKESFPLGCASQDSYPRKSVQRGSGKLGSKHTVKFSKETWHQNFFFFKNREKRVHLSKSVRFMSVVLARRNSRKRSHEETLYQERCAHQAAQDLAKNIFKLKSSDKTIFCRHRLQRDQRSENSLLIQEHRCTW